ncbi:MAG: linear amide C-N hydrolase [Oscillospiraceae bacterium]|nr:linear amide C-N hydrolase [Oscillospiraceae bacterium]
MRRQKKRYFNPYHAYRGKSRWKKILLWGAAALAALLLLLALVAWLMFRRELAITGTVRLLESGSPAYFMEVKGDYYFEEFLARGGASSDMEVSVFLSQKISKGFYTAPVGAYREGCSVLSAQSADGSHLWGRNYDWTDSVPIIVRHVPKEGYASLSTCDFQNITGSGKTLPVGMMNKMLAIAALYVPLDGVNEAGLCVADLEVNEGGMPDPDTEKPDLTITTAIRLLLDKAATVDEALALLEQYDIHPSGGISHHLAVSDASGRSVSVEFTEDGFTAIDAPAVTNFNLANGDPTAGGENAKERYETLTARLEQGVSTAEQVRDALAAVTQTDTGWVTQWSMVYDRTNPYITWYFKGDFTSGVTLPISSDS